MAVRRAFDTDELVPTRRSLIVRLRDLDDSASWREFFEIYWKLIYRAAIKGGLSETEAEEVVQETIIGVARKMEDFDYNPEKCSFKGWLMHVTRCRIIDHLRKRQTQPQGVMPLPSQGTTSTTVFDIADPAAGDAFGALWDDEWKSNLTTVAMERVKQKTKAEHFQIFYLHTMRNLNAPQIREMLGVSSAKVYVVCHRIGALVKREVRALEARTGEAPS